MELYLTGIPVVLQNYKKNIFPKLEPVHIVLK